MAKSKDRWCSTCFTVYTLPFEPGAKCQCGVSLEYVENVFEKLGDLEMPAKLKKPAVKDTPPPKETPKLPVRDVKMAYLDSAQVPSNYFTSDVADPTSAAGLEGAFKELNRDLANQHRVSKKRDSIPEPERKVFKMDITIPQMLNLPLAKYGRPKWPPSQRPERKPEPIWKNVQGDVRMKDYFVSSPSRNCKGPPPSEPRQEPLSQGFEEVPVLQEPPPEVDLDAFRGPKQRRLSNIDADPTVMNAIAAGADDRFRNFDPRARPALNNAKDTAPL